MIIKLHKNFVKQTINLKPSQQKRLQVALHQFQEEPYHPDLYNHPLSGEWKGHRSIAFGGDWRAHYKPIDENTVLFVTVGTHSQLYK